MDPRCTDMRNPDSILKGSWDLVTRATIQVTRPILTQNPNQRNTYNLAYKVPILQVDHRYPGPDPAQPDFVDFEIKLRPAFPSKLRDPNPIQFLYTL